MRIACLDLEGVLVPEIWQSVAERSGVDDLNLTTRDIPDYHELMRRRLAILDREGILISDIQAVIAGMEPLPGACEFTARLREQMQLIILSDTFAEFAQPLMRQLGWPTLLCNALTIDAHGRIRSYHLRQEDGKRHAVRSFQGMNLTVRAAGDSYNDLGMILTADAGAFFRPPDSIRAEHPSVPVLTAYDELLHFLTVQ